MAEELSFNLGDPRFQDPLVAAEYLESLRWPDGPVCPHCGESERKPYRLKSNTRRLWKCAACRKQYTVTVGTIFEGSHIGLDKWLAAFSLLCSSKKGMSAHQLHRMLGITYKSAWFMAHRIRYAMQQSPFQSRLTGTVEVDETYIGGKVRNKKKRDRQRVMGRGVGKTPVVALVQRGGEVRSFRTANVTAETLHGAVLAHVDRQARLVTDAYPAYRGLSKVYERHDVINHQDYEYVMGDIHTNTVEGYFSILKRGVNGVYHHVSEAHLPRYLAEFDFRYNTRTRNGYTDGARTVKALTQVGGRRLTYRDATRS